MNLKNGGFLNSKKNWSNTPIDNTINNKHFFQQISTENYLNMNDKYYEDFNKGSSSAKGNFIFVQRLCDLSYPHYNLDLHSYG